MVGVVVVVVVVVVWTRLETGTEGGSCNVM